MSGDGEDVGRKKIMESREIQKRRDLAQLVVQPAAHHSSTQLHQLVKRGRRRELRVVLLYCMYLFFVVWCDKKFDLYNIYSSY